MELPRRQPGDILLPAGEMRSLRQRLRTLSRKHPLRTVIACAFDHRTRILPFFYTDTRMAPAGVRALGSALADCGFDDTRIVLQQWNRNFRPSACGDNGRMPDLLLISSMQLHSERMIELIRDACSIDADRRPLVIVGGPKVIYEPWDAFSADPDDPWGADLAVRGEEYVLLSVLETLLTISGGGESLRKTFLRARNGGMLDDVPGLMYPLGERDGVAARLVDTGPQRLLGDLDELPHPELGYALLEPPSRKAGLGDRPLPEGKVRRHAPYSSLVLTAGCRFACPYCPIPAYNQRQLRFKSGQRIAVEMQQLAERYGIEFFFGTDDNFFNDPQRATEILASVAARQSAGRPLAERMNWATEATVHDTLKMREHLPLARRAGLRAIWMGVEDMTGALVSKGQTPERTTEAFELLGRNGISPMPMLMHHDDQPLLTRGTAGGLINQIRLLRRAGAASLQALMIVPSPGSRSQEQVYASGQVIASAGGQPVEPHMTDGNYVIASRRARPWGQQINLIVAYLYFYNPLRLLGTLIRPRSDRRGYEAAMQLVGIAGMLLTARRTLSWAAKLLLGTVRRRRTPPQSALPIVEPPPAHAEADATAGDRHVYAGR